jgi:hypothetical protein
MIRIEIIANQSVQDDVINNLEQAVPGFLYTVIPLVNGRGKASYKLGTTTWPETNFILVAYAMDDEGKVERTVNQVMRYIKLRYPDEGIKLFIMHDNKI